jgi:hypothetical protein
VVIVKKLISWAGLRHRVFLWADIHVSEQNSASIFRVEVCRLINIILSSFLLNFEAPDDDHIGRNM